MADAAPSTESQGLFVGDLRQLPGVGSLTGMFKQRADAAVALAADGLAGDRQADRTHHGGPERALNHYPAEHYDHWRQEYPDLADQFEPGLLGENLSTRGLTEADVHPGDVFALGTARIAITQPRYPCFKIARRTGIRNFAQVVAQTGRSGWLYRVVEPGEVAPDDVPARIEAADHGFTLARLWSVRNDPAPDLDEMAALAELPPLAESWRQAYRSRREYLLQRRAD